MGELKDKDFLFALYVLHCLAQGSYTGAGAGDLGANTCGYAPRPRFVQRHRMTATPPRRFQCDAVAWAFFPTSDAWAETRTRILKLYLLRAGPRGRAHEIRGSVHVSRRLGSDAGSLHVGSVNLARTPF